jgi:hypothetical protein
MPLPYREDFESYPLGATPKYLTDFFGAFEVAPRDGGGKCLRQVITRRGIAWCGDDEPVTIVGNPAWRDYEAACDVCLDSSQSARLYGRIMQVPHGNQSPTGYALCLGGDGAWQLRAGKKSLLSGKLSILPRSWHRMELRFRGERITVALDGRDAGSVDDATFGHGLVGLGCRYETVMFDNLAVTGRAAPTGLQPARTTSSSDWSEEYGAEMATDGDPSTRWNAAAGKGIGEWVELDFQRPIRFDSVRCSQFARRITRYRIEVADGDRFVEVFSGNTDQKDEFSARFKPATASKLRFVVLGIATDPAQAPPSLYEIEVFDRG